MIPRVLAAGLASRRGEQVRIAG